MNKIIYSAMSLFPVLAFAQANVTLNLATDLVRQGKTIIDLLIPMAFALAIIYFFYGVAKYIGKAGDPKEAAAGKSIMIYGVIAIAVMASLYGIIAYLQTSLGVNSGATITVPKIN